MTALVGLVLLQRSRTGVQLELMLLGLLLLPAHLRRVLAWRGHLPPPAAWLLLPEAGALLGVGGIEVTSWALGLALAACLLHARPSPRAAEGAVWPEWADLAWVPLAFLTAACSSPPAWPAEAAWTLALLPLVLEGTDPLRPRSADALLRRSAAWLALLATSLLRAPLDLSLGDVVVGSARCLALAVTGGASTWALASRHVAARRLRRWTFRVLAPLGLLLVGWTAGELAWRVVPNRYRTLVPPRPHAFHVPNAEYTWEGAVLRPRQPRTNTLTWNRRGWHDLDHDPAKPPGVVRLLVMGDSFVEGVQVPLASLYHRQLEAGLNRGAAPRVEVIAMGTSGWGQVDELRALRGEGLDYDPDLVLIGFLGGNDVRNNHPRLQRLAVQEEAGSSAARGAFVEATRRGLFFTAFLADKADQFLCGLAGHPDPLDAEVYRDPPQRWPELWAEAWVLTAEAVRALRDLLRERGVRLVVVGFPGAREVEALAAGQGPFDFSLPRRRMKAVCAELEVPYLELFPDFAALPPAEREGLHLSEDFHWTEAGHRLAAEATLRRLDESGLRLELMGHPRR